MTADRAKKMESLIWWLVYGGLVSVVLGFVLQRVGPVLAWGAWIAGGALMALGLALIVIRSRMPQK